MISSTRVSRWISESLTPLDIYQRGLTNVFCYRRSSLQEICIAEAGAYGKSLILDGQLQTSVADEFLYHEALVHPAMIQIASPRNILVVGGGDGGAAREVLRWRSAKHVTVVEVDREVVEACREHLYDIHQNVFADPRLEVVIDDGLRFLRNTNRTFDVIIFDLPDPVEGAPWLRLYDKQCFETARERLSHQGTFTLQAGPVSPVNVGPLCRIVRNVGSAFPYVHAYSTFVPSFGIPLAFVLAAARPIATRPSPEVVDRVIAEKVRGRLRMFDGVGFLGLMQTPAYLRKALRSDLEANWSSPAETEGAAVLASAGAF